MSRRHIARLTAVLSVAAGVWLAAIRLADAQSQSYFGAISFSPSSGAAGWGFDFPSRGEAAEASLRNCSRYADDCEVVTWFADGCGALVASKESFIAVWNPSKEVALRRAMLRCRAEDGPGCAVVRWVCTTNSQW